MAKVAAARPPLPSSTHHFDKVGAGGNSSVSKITTAVKRKTPSELRVCFSLFFTFTLFFFKIS